MTNDPSSCDAAALEKWVAETAERKGISEGELFDEILSSYWVLEELSGLIADSDVEERSRLDQGSSADGGQSSPGQLTEPTDDGASEPARKPHDELCQELQKLRTAIVTFARSHEDDSDALESEVATLREQVTELSSRVDSELQERDELEASVDRTERSQRQLERQLQQEFDNIEKVLKHLLDATDELERRLDTVKQSCQSDIEAVKSHDPCGERLAELKREANLLDLETAACGHCDQEVDLGLLERPSCPRCDESFSSLTTKSRFLFRKGVLRTEPTSGCIDDGTDR